MSDVQLAFISAGEGLEAGQEPSVLPQTAEYTKSYMQKTLRATCPKSP